MITYTRKIPYSAAANEYGRVLLKIVSDTGDIYGTLLSVHELYSCDLSKSGVRLFRRGRRDGKANAALLRATLHNGRFALYDCAVATVLDKLVDCWH